MSGPIVQPTIIQRATVTQNFREILRADESFPGIRRVQVLVPQSPAAYAILSPDPRFINRDTDQPIRNMAHAAGYDRSYKGILLTPGAQLVFHIFPHQGLWAACEENFAELGIICEYMAGGL